MHFKDVEKQKQAKSNGVKGKKNNDQDKKLMKQRQKEHTYNQSSGILILGEKN